MFLQNDDANACYTIQNEHCSKFFSKLISQCLKKKKDDRLTFSEIKSFAVNYREKEKKDEEIEKSRKEIVKLQKDLNEEKSKTRILEIENANLTEECEKQRRISILEQERDNRSLENLNKEIMEKNNRIQTLENANHSLEIDLICAKTVIEENESQKRILTREHSNEIQREKRTSENLNKEIMEKNNRIQALENANQILKNDLILSKTEKELAMQEKHNVEYCLKNKILQLENELQELSRKSKQIEIQNYMTSTPKPSTSLKYYDTLERSTSAYQYLTPPPTPTVIPTHTSINVPIGSVPTGKTVVSGGSANGREIFRGPRGGEFYMSSTGTKQYVKK